MLPHSSSLPFIFRRHIKYYKEFLTIENNFSNYFIGNIFFTNCDTYFKLFFFFINVIYKNENKIYINQLTQSVSFDLNFLIFFKIT